MQVLIRFEGIILTKLQLKFICVCLFLTQWYHMAWKTWNIVHKSYFYGDVLVICGAQKYASPFNFVDKSFWHIQLNFAFLFHRKKKVVQVWNNMIVRKWWQNFHSWVNFLNVFSRLSVFHLAHSKETQYTQTKSDTIISIWCSTAR